MSRVVCYSPKEEENIVAGNYLCDANYWGDDDYIGYNIPACRNCGASNPYFKKSEKPEDGLDSNSSIVRYLASFPPEKRWAETIKSLEGRYSFNKESTTEINRLRRELNSHQNFLAELSKKYPVVGQEVTAFVFYRLSKKVRWRDSND